MIRNFTNNGIDFGPSASTSSQLSVSNTLISDNGFTGIYIHPNTTGTVTGIINHVAMENNATNGLYVDIASQTVNVTVSVSANNKYGIDSATSAGSANIMVRNSTVGNNTIDGLISQGTGATIRVTRSTITGNATGWDNSSGGVVLSYGDNNIDGNTNVNTEPPNPLTYK